MSSLCDMSLLFQIYSWCDSWCDRIHKDSKWNRDNLFRFNARKGVGVEYSIQNVGNTCCRYALLWDMNSTVFSFDIWWLISCLQVSTCISTDWWRSGYTYDWKGHVCVTQSVNRYRISQTYTLLKIVDMCPFNCDRNARNQSIMCVWMWEHVHSESIVIGYYLSIGTILQGRCILMPKVRATPARKSAVL